MTRIKKNRQLALNLSRINNIGFLILVKLHKMNNHLVNSELICHLCLKGAL